MKNIIIALAVLAMCGASAFAAQAVTNCTLTIDKYVAVTADATAATTMTGGELSKTKDVNVSVTANCPGAVTDVAVTQGNLPAGASVAAARETLPAAFTSAGASGTVRLTYTLANASVSAGVDYAHTLTVTVAAD
jgi:hypothetical protein